MRSPRVISLFAGIGGFDLGFERAGMTTVAAVEKEATCRKLLAEKFPDAAIYDDVCSVGSKSLPPADIVCGGFPCQDLSVAGKRKGLEGKRSGLFYEMVKIIDECKPAVVVWENVPGLLSSDKGQDMLRVLCAFRDIGYHGGWRVLDAQYLGVAQRRRRVFGVFTRGDIGVECAVEILSLREGMRGHPPPSRKAGKDVAGTLKGGSGERGWPNSTDTDGFFIPEVAKSCRTPSGGIDREDMHTLIPEVCGALTDGAHCGGGLNGQDAYTGRVIPVALKPSHYTRGKGDQEPLVLGFSCKDAGNDIGEDVSPTLRAMPHGGQAAVAFDTTQITSKANRSNPQPGDPCHPLAAEGHAPAIAQVQWASGGGQIENDTAQALPSEAEHNYQFARVGMAVRRLTPTECERLQGFPDGWTDGFSDSARYRMLGNAVAVPVAEWIGRRIVSELANTKGETQ